MAASNGLSAVPVAVVEATVQPPAARPFLKFAGGKRQLLPDFVPRVALVGQFGRYHEPFLGGGALFFELVRRGRVEPEQALLSDANANLMDAYIGVAANVEAVIRRLRAHARAYSEPYYYAVRARLPRDTVGRAARLVFLNKTCFNGLHRENGKGEFNAPFGHLENPTICDAENLRAVAEVIVRASIEARDFEVTLSKANAGDFVYCDPPYVPISPTASFTSYAGKPFTLDDQRRLARVAHRLRDMGVQVMLSNADVPLVHELYRGFTIERVDARRAISCKGDKRGPVSELLIQSF